MPTDLREPDRLALVDIDADHEMVAVHDRLSADISDYFRVEYPLFHGYDRIETSTASSCEFGLDKILTCRVLS